MTLEQVCNNNYRFVLWCTSSEDATQATFLKVCKVWRSEYETWNEPQVRAWLRRVANNTLIDAKRYDAHRNHEELGEYIAPGDIENDVACRQSVLTCLERLKPDQRRILLLVGQGYRYQERDTDKAHVVTKSCVYRARNAFKREWQTIA